MSPHLLQRKRTHFVLWRPRVTNPAPRLVLGTFQAGNPPLLVDMRLLPLRQSAQFSDLWELPAVDCNLTPGGVYHYWFRLRDGRPGGTQDLDCTDPTAGSVDWRLTSPLAPPNETRKPAGVVRFTGTGLEPCDPHGETEDLDTDQPGAHFAPNNKLVIYELPTNWAAFSSGGTVEMAAGTFRDALALVERAEPGANFADVPAVAGSAHLLDLGVNCVELLPPADSLTRRTWGYATSNYFAPDYDLGFPEGHFSPTALHDYGTLVRALHARGIRVFYDAVMAFATGASVPLANYLDFFVQRGTGDPEEDAREDFGGALFKYAFFTQSYDPIEGDTRNCVPSRQLLKTHIARWIQDLHVDGLRLDSVVNINNWDFVEEVRNYGRELWAERWGNRPGADERFLVVGEELALPLGLITENRLDALWNDEFLYLLKCAIVGQVRDKAGSFEETVRRMVDCRRLGFRDGAEAVIYFTSHDVEGFRKERLFNYLQNNGVAFKEKQIKLAFACLLTAVGVPMILAGEEFADEHDLPVRHPEKQTDPVNFSRLSEPWRQDISRYAARLIRFRISNEALAVNETSFLHEDMNDGKRVFAWQRGPAPNGDLVVVVANFSDWGGDPNGEYRVPNWPALPEGRRWREISRERDVPLEWAGREPLFPWEAKIYAAV